VSIITLTKSNNNPFAFAPARIYSKVVRVFQDDLPTISTPRLRAAGAITADMTSATIALAGGPVEVALALVRFPNGGSWSFFVAPCCGRKAKSLRLHDDELMCRPCLRARGVLWRCEPAGARRRAEMRISKLKAKLQSPIPLRLKPHLRYSKLERRKRLEAALARCEYIVARAQFKRRVKDDVHFEVPAELLSSRSRPRRESPDEASC
jgi:hypothetical protein